MLVTLIANNWFINILAAFFISLLDSIAYLLLAAGYNIFYAVSQIDIFGTPGGESVYETITTRIYSAISVVMVFVFAYYLIMMIVDPDGGKGKATSALVKETIIAFITVILLPTVFRYMSLFQKHVITNNTIGNIILGSAGTSGNENIDYGKQVSLIVFTSFYHPEGTAYADYFENDGQMVDDPMGVCTGGGANNSVCEAWVKGLQEWKEDPGIGAVDKISKKSKLYNTTNDEGGMYYMWIITTVVGIVAAWFFFSYAIDVGTRCVKLGFLQLIAPVPVLMKIFPTGKKTFDSWFAELKKSYLEIFLRLAVIFFIVQLCTMVPDFISAVWDSGSGVSGGFLTRALATVCLILGLLKFAKDAPQLFKTIFASGGGLFAGMDWKPGMKRRVSENEYAMKGIGATTGAIGGIGSSLMAGWNAYKRMDPEGSIGKFGAGAYAAYSGIRNLPRGIISGAKAGLKNSPKELSGKNLMNSLGTGLNAAQSSEIKRQNKVDQNGHFIPINIASEDIKDGEGNVIHKKGDIYFDKFKKFRSIGNNIVEAKDDAKDSFKSAILGEKLTSAAIETVDQTNGFINKVLGSKEIKDATDKITKKYAGAYDNIGKNMTWTDDNGNIYSSNGTYQVKDTRTAEQRLLAEKGSVINRNGKKSYMTGDGYFLDENEFQKRYGGEKMLTLSCKSAADLDKLVASEKNAKMAEVMNDKLRSGSAVNMANALSSWKHGNLRSQDIENLNKIVSDAKISDNINTVEDFLKYMSAENIDKTELDIATLKKIESSMNNIKINAEMINSSNNTKKAQEKAANDKASGK